jgi:hypothetical protein
MLGNSPPKHQEEMTDGRPISKEDEALEEEDDECGDDENDIELYDHNVVDLDMYYTQENMDDIWWYLSRNGPRTCTVMNI